MDVVRSDACQCQRLMIVAHNPGMAHLASCLAERHVDMPTAAIAAFDVGEEDWMSLGYQDPLELIHYMRPKAL